MNTPRFRQVPVTRYPPATPREVETRYRCIDANHEPRTFNPIQDASWCLCGRAIWPGDVAVAQTGYERAEASAHRPDSVGREARAWLAQTWGRTE